MQLGMDFWNLRPSSPSQAARIAGNNIVYAIGDSRTTATTSPAGGYNQRYPITTARQLLAGQADLNYGTIFGVGGYTVQQVQENLFPAALASPADTLVLLAGTNDVGGNPAAASARISEMAAAWVGSRSSRVIHILDECPWAGATGNKAGHAQLRDAIRAMANPPAGVYIVPSWRAITGGGDGDTPLADAYRDTVHFSIPGSIRVGRALASSLAQSLPTTDFHGRPVDLTQSFVPGTLAANDMMYNNTITAGTHAVSMVEFEGDTWLQISMDSVLGFINVYRASNAIPAGWVAGSTLFESNMDFVLLEGHSNIRISKLYATKQSGGSQPHYATGAGVADGDHSGSSNDAKDLSFPDGAEYRGTLWTPRMRLAADATQFRPWWYNVTSRLSLPMTGTILLRRPQCRVVG